MFLDIVVGLLIGLVAALVSIEGIDVAMIVFGVFSALAPDIDFIIWLARNEWRSNEYAHEHRDLLHRPILFSGVIGVFIWMYAGPTYASIWILGTMWHFIHDTFDGGWGIKWFDPFYEGYFTLVSYSPKKHIRNLEEQRGMAKEGGNSEWLREMYPHINGDLIIGIFLVVGAIAFIVGIFLISQ